jgi:hypothetical protein
MRLFLFLAYLREEGTLLHREGSLSFIPEFQAVLLSTAILRTIICKGLNLIYSGGRDWEGYVSRPAWAKS